MNIRNSQLRYNLCEDTFSSAKVDTVHILELKNNQIEWDLVSLQN